jgi:hypothetical protein
MAAPTSPARTSRSTRLLAYGTFVLLAMSGCGAHDDRQLPGSANVSLESVMARYHVPMPDCETTDLRYLASDAWGDSLLLQFGAPNDCIDRFLSRLRVKQLAPENLDMQIFSDESASAKFKWTFAPNGSYAHYSGEVGRVTYELIVDQGARPWMVYLIASGPG